MIDNIKGAIFDLDGTLVDSLWVWASIDDDYLGKYGFSVPDNFNEEINHLSFTQTAHYIKEKFNIPDSIDKMLNDWQTMALNHYSHNVKLKSGALDFLKLLKSKSIKISLATSNSVELLTPCLKNNGIFEYFDAITTTDEVKRSKEAPDVYLLAAEKIGIPPSECLVFEDILPAAMGAKSAGMKVCIVKDKYCITPKEELLKYADKYIDSYLDLL